MIGTGCQVTILATSVFERMCASDPRVRSRLRRIGSEGLLGTEALQPRTYVRGCARTHVRTYVCMYVCMYACIYVCMYVCMYVCVYIYMYVRVYIYICMYACICVRACVYVHVYIIATFLVISKYLTGAILCLPLDLPPKSKLYVILAICYERKCVTVAAILNINSIMFNIDI